MFTINEQFNFLVAVAIWWNIFIIYMGWYS